MKRGGASLVAPTVEEIESEGEEEREENGVGQIEWERESIRGFRSRISGCRWRIPQMGLRRIAVAQGGRPPTAPTRRPATNIHG